MLFLVMLTILLSVIFVYHLIRQHRKETKEFDNKIDNIIRLCQEISENEAMIEQKRQKDISRCLAREKVTVGVQALIDDLREQAYMGYTPAAELLLKYAESTKKE